MNEPTAATASSVVTSSPSSPGVKRFQTKRAGASDTRATGRTIRCQPARRYGATGRSSGLSSCSAIHAFVFACSSGLRCRRIEEDDRDDDRDREPEREQPARHPRRELVERAPEHVAEHAERRRPQPGAEHVVGQELAQRHVRRAGDERRDRAHEPDEAADQDRHPAALVEERLDLLEPLLGDLHARAVLDHELAAEPAAERVGRHVAEHRAGPHDRDQHHQRDLALAGDEAADDHRRLARAR